jgi:hypothetical protein
MLRKAYFLPGSLKQALEPRWRGPGHSHVLAYSRPVDFAFAHSGIRIGPSGTTIHVLALAHDVIMQTRWTWDHLDTTGAVMQAHAAGHGRESCSAES